VHINSFQAQTQLLRLHIIAVEGGLDRDSLLGLPAAKDINLEYPSDKKGKQNHSVDVQVNGDTETMVEVWVQYAHLGNDWGLA